MWRIACALRRILASELPLCRSASPDHARHSFLALAFPFKKKRISSSWSLYGYVLGSSAVFTEVFIYRNHGGNNTFAVHLLQPDVPAQLIIRGPCMRVAFTLWSSHDTSVVLKRPFLLASNCYMLLNWKCCCWRPCVTSIYAFICISHCCTTLNWGKWFVFIISPEILRVIYCIFQKHAVLLRAVLQVEHQEKAWSKFSRISSGGNWSSGALICPHLESCPLFACQANEKHASAISSWIASKFIKPLLSNIGAVVTDTAAYCKKLMSKPLSRKVLRVWRSTASAQALCVCYRK